MWVKAKGLHILTCPRKYANLGALKWEQLVPTDAMSTSWPGHSLFESQVSLWAAHVYGIVFLILPHLHPLALFFIFCLCPFSPS